MRFLFLLLLSFPAFAGPLEDFAIDYADGTALVEQQDYYHLYVHSSDRNIKFLSQEDHGERIDVRYSTSMVYDDAPYQQSGVASFFIEDGKVVRVEQIVMSEKAAVDMTVAGQAADIGTTAAALQMGFAEGNPAVAGAIASPIGAASLIGLKLGAASILDQQDVRTCVEGRTAVGTIGWIAAAWNIGVIAAGPLAGLILGTATGLGVWKSVAEDAPLRCVGE